MSMVVRRLGFAIGASVIAWLAASAAATWIFGSGNVLVWVIALSVGLAVYLRDGRSRPGFGQREHDEARAVVAEPCISCGTDTAPGTRRFSSRRRGRDTHTGTEGFLCYACQVGSAGPGAEQEIPLSGRYAVIDLPGGIFR
jgi:hypothetical protein